MKKRLLLALLTVALVIFALAITTGAQEQEHTHAYGDWQGLDENEHQRVCDCGQAEVAEHDFVYTTVKEATHLDGALIEYTCTTCGLTGTTLEASYHSIFNEISSVVVVEPTCINSGYTEYTCTCGESWRDSFVDPTGEHTYVDGVCACGKIDPSHTHTFGEWTKVDSTYHQGTCVCGETEMAEHEFVKYECYCGATEYIKKWDVSATENDDVTAYLLTNGQFILSGTGAMADDACQWNFYNSPYGFSELIIEEGITYIGIEAFSYCYSLTSVTIPSSVTSIGDSAFLHAEALASVVIPKTVVHVGSVAFGVYEGSLMFTGGPQLYIEAWSKPEGWADDWYARYATPIWHYQYDHVYEKTITKEPTHTENGVATYTCVCGDSYVEAVDKTGHIFGEWTKVDSTYHQRACSCGETEVAEHKYNILVEIVKPTCTDRGYTVYACLCGDETLLEPTSSLGHEYGDYESVDDEYHKLVCVRCSHESKYFHNLLGEEYVAPTHTKGGYEKLSCDKCYHTITKYFEPTEEHTYSSVSYPADCFEPVRMVYTCECGDTYTEYFGEPLGHIYTYASMGESHRGTCVCGDFFDEDHSFGAWADLDEATKVRECICGEKDCLVIEKEDDKVNVKPSKPDKEKDKVKIDIVFDENTFNEIGIEIIPEILEQLNNMETEINTDLGAIILDAIASTKVAEKDGNVNIGIKDITTEKENKTGHRVFNITINDQDGNPILPPSESENNGTVTLSFKYQKGLVKEQIKVAYRDENGKLEHMKVEHYDPETGEVRFKTAHLSEYVIYTEEAIVESIFTFKGYSMNLATGQIGYGFEIDYDAIAAYERATGKTLDFGIVFASYEYLDGAQPLNNDGSVYTGSTGKAIKGSLKGYTYTTYDFILNDITEDLYEHRFTIAAYVCDGEAVTYYHSQGVSDTVEGVSYNTIQSILKEQGEI